MLQYKREKEALKQNLSKRFSVDILLLLFSSDYEKL